MTKRASPRPNVAAAADRIELLLTFVRIVQTGSLSAAAARMGTTQPTVSRRLQQLERTCSVQLLQRSTHAMRMTEDGQRFYERAKELLEGWDALESDLRGVRAEVRGLLRVAVPNVFGQKHLVGPLAAFMRRHPRMTVEWLLHHGSVDFAARGIDCAIRVGELTDSSLVAIRLADVPRKLVVAPELLEEHGKPKHPRDLASFPWLAIPAFYRRQVMLRHVRTRESAEVSFQPRLTTDNLFALTNAALERLGLAVVSEWIVREHLARGTLVELLPEWRPSPVPVSVLYPHAPHHPARLRLFVEVMREAIPVVVGDETRPLRRG